MSDESRLELGGPRVLLRDHVRDDLAALAAYQADPRYLAFCAPEVGTPAFARELLHLFLAWSAARPRRNFQLAIVDRASGALVGSCGLRGEGHLPCVAELGLELGPAWWGRGLAAEAARLLLDFGFRTLALTEVRGVSLADNARVAALVRRLGFEAIAGASPERPPGTPEARALTEWRLTATAWAAAPAQSGQPGGTTK